jgi:hypothetical protein
MMVQGTAPWFNVSNAVLISSSLKVRLINSSNFSFRDMYNPTSMGMPALG